MNRLRQYRFLMIVCGLAILAGVWEVTHKSRDEKSGRGGNAGAPKTADLPPDRKVFIEVYRKTSAAEFDLGLEHYNQQDFPAALDHFREALSTEVKTNEDLLWYNILTLLHLDKDDREIASAIADWRRNFPHSSRYSAPYWSFAVELLEGGAPESESDAAVDRWRRQSTEQEMPDPYWAVAVRRIQGNATEKEIDSAVGRWRRKSPHSDLPDPRRMAPSRESRPKSTYRD